MSRNRNWWALAFAVPLAFSLAFVACGGDDDKSSSSDSSGSSANIATGSDTQYVADICKATKKFSDDLDKVMKDAASLKNPDDIAKKFTGPFEDFSNAFAKAKPPKDLKDWHAQTSKNLKDLVAKLKKGDAATLASAFDSNPIGDPPKEAQDRLQKAAANNKDCKDANFDFGG